MVTDSAGTIEVRTNGQHVPLSATVAFIPACRSSQTPIPSTSPHPSRVRDETAFATVATHAAHGYAGALSHLRAGGPPSCTQLIGPWVNRCPEWAALNQSAENP